MDWVLIFDTNTAAMTLPAIIAENLQYYRSREKKLDMVDPADREVH
jgi:hypothetical protein